MRLNGSIWQTKDLRHIALNSISDQVGQSSPLDAALVESSLHGIPLSGIALPLLLIITIEAVLLRRVELTLSCVAGLTCQERFLVQGLDQLASFTRKWGEVIHNSMRFRGLSCESQLH